MRAAAPSRSVPVDASRPTRAQRRPPRHRRAVALAVALALAAGMAPGVAATFTWTGAGTTNNWSNGSNWGGSDILNFSTLRFGGTQRLGAVNNLPDGLMQAQGISTLSVDGLSFLAGAGAFNLSGNRIWSVGNITNLSDNAQTLSLPVSATVNNQVWDGGTKGMNFTGDMTLDTVKLTLQNKVAISNAAKPFRIGDGGAATLNMYAGSSLSFSAAADLQVGYQAGGTGTLLVSGDGSRVTGVDTLSVGFARVPLGGVSFGAGTGTVTLADRAQLQSVNGRIGDFDGPVYVNGSGKVTVKERAIWTNTQLLSVGYGSPATLAVESDGEVITGSMRIGDNAVQAGSASVTGTKSRIVANGELSVGRYGTGTLTASGGASLRSGSANIGAGAIGELSSKGTVTLQKLAGETAAATWTNDGDLVVGRRGNGTLALSGGSTLTTANLDIAGSRLDSIPFPDLQGVSYGKGVVTVDGAGSRITTTGLWMGSDDASLTVTNGGALSAVTASLSPGLVDKTSTATFDQGARWTVGSGGLSAGNSQIEVRYGSVLSSPFVKLATTALAVSNTKVHGLDAQVKTTTLTVGDLGQATLTVDQFGKVTGDYGPTPGNLVIGSQRLSSGSVIVDGGGSLASFDEVRVGGSGSGDLSITFGGSVSSRTAIIGHSANGTVVVGSTSTLSGNQNNRFSQTGTLTVGQNGRGSLLVYAGGIAESGRLVAYAGGTVTLLGGRLDYASTHDDILAAGGVFDWQRGTVNVRGSTDLTRGNAFLRGALTGGTLMLSAGRTLAVSDTLDIGSQDLVVEGGSLSAGTLQVGGGVVRMRAGLAMGPGQIQNLQGYGTVTAPVSGGGTGNPTTRALIRADGGTLEVGDASSVAGFSFSGIAEARANSTLVLKSKLPAELSYVVGLYDGALLSTVKGALLTSTGQLVTDGAAQVQGRFTNNGRVDGGTGSLTFLNDVDGSGSFDGHVIFRAAHAVGVGAQRLDFGGGDAEYGESALLTLDLLGYTAGTQYDQLAGLDELRFDGRLQLVFGNGFTPVAGTRLQLFDFQHFAGSLSSEHIGVTGFDRRLLDFSRLAVDGSVSITAVPEPSTWATLLAGMLAMTRVVRRRRGAR